MGKAWGLGCESCPSHGGSDYKEMCGSGPPGVMVNPMTNQTEEIDECQLMPGMRFRIIFISISILPSILIQRNPKHRSKSFIILSYVHAQRHVPAW